MTIEDDLQALREEFDVHKKEQDTRWSDHIEVQKQNTASINTLVTQLTEQTESTKGVAQLYADIQGTMRIGVGLQKLILWLAKWGTIGAVLAAVIKFTLDQFSP